MTSNRIFGTCLFVLAVCTASAPAMARDAEQQPRSEARVQEKGAGAPTAAAGEKAPVAAAAQADDPDLDVNLVQPDFAVAALPTTLRLPRHKLAFRLTHRFNQPLEDSGLESLFGLDSGAIIGFEFRYGLAPGAQIGVYRTSDRTIQIFAQYDVKTQGDGLPLGLAAYGSIEGTNNFRDTYSPGFGAIISREIGKRAAVYAQPLWVINTNPLPSEAVDHNSTAIIGLGVRLRILDTTYVIAEVAPRIAGYKPGTTHAAFGVEKRAGGHLFQLTFANNPGTTLANVARGGPSGNNWYLGFNLARKFY